MTTAEAIFLLCLQQGMNPAELTQPGWKEFKPRNPEHAQCTQSFKSCVKEHRSMMKPEEDGKTTDKTLLHACIPVVRSSMIVFKAEALEKRLIAPGASQAPLKRKLPAQKIKLSGKGVL